MTKRTPEPPAVPDLGPWRYEIEAVDGMLPFGRYRIYLIRGVMIYGPEAWGWTRWTLNGAYRKGQRELRRMQQRDTRREMRQAKIETLVRRG